MTARLVAALVACLGGAPAAVALTGPAAAVPGSPAAPRPADHREWLACAKDEDCTSVELGCAYWQPVNKASADAMKDAYPPVCAASAPPGPQPPARCKEHACVNLRIQDNQKIMGPGPDDSVARRRVAGKTRRGETAPRASPIDVRISSLRPDYPHDDLNPPLKEFIPALKRCIDLHAGASPWGEVYADFEMAPDGHVASASFSAKFIATENTAAFVNCLATPFKKLRFSPPKDGQGIAASISYHVPFGGGR